MRIPQQPPNEIILDSFDINPIWLVERFLRWLSNYSLQASAFVLFLGALGYALDDICFAAGSYFARNDYLAVLFGFFLETRLELANRNISSTREEIRSRRRTLNRLYKDLKQHGGSVVINNWINDTKNALEQLQEVLHRQEVAFDLLNERETNTREPRNRILARFADYMVEKGKAFPPKK